MSLDVSRLAPSDAVAALRSFPRRFRAVVALADDEDESILHRHGPDGRSVAEHVDLASRDLAVLADAVRRTLEHDRPSLPPAVLDDAARADAHGIDQSLEAALDLLTLEATSLSERIEHVPADDWGRVGEVVGNGAVTAIDLLREAVRATADHLRAAERTRAEV